ADVDTTHTIVIDLPVRDAPSHASPPPRGVPDVRGMSLRQAVRSLHSAGFRVQLARGTPSASVTEPAAGVVASAGSLVRLRYIR
ncbi:MAG TPA: PASTA domain-containing protein, partial [Gemmatimonadaceae bacterium]|nr:PASTA domain-containing protein [Gemmatimonadaceae bacterium]